MKYLLFEKFKNQPRSVWVVGGLGLLLVSYTVSLFFYLRVVGVYGVAVLKDVTTSSDGVNWNYDFFYEGKEYTGSFDGIGSYKIGDKYFVLFSRSHPSKNLLQYNDPVPSCLKDSINSVWSTLPQCK